MICTQVISTSPESIFRKEEYTWLLMDYLPMQWQTSYKNL